MEKEVINSNQKSMMVRGTPLSGRIWKQPTKKNKKNAGKVKSNNKYIEDLKKNKSNKLNLKLLEEQIREESSMKKEEMKQRKKQNEKNRQENLKKSEITQKITNPKTIKKIRKNQLHKSIKIRPE